MTNIEIKAPLDRVLEEAGGWVPPRFPEFDRKNRGSDFIFVTPRMANAWLLYLNEGNRPPESRAEVEAMARQMAAGQFICNGEGFIFGYWGGIVSGQKRAEACALAERIAAEEPDKYKPFKGFETLVVWGMPEEARLVVDRPRLRKDGHTLTQQTYTAADGTSKTFTDAFNLAAAAHLVNAVWSGTLFEHRHQMSPIEVLPFAQNYGALLYDGLSAWSSARDTVMLAKSAGAALYFLVNDADLVLGPEFWEALVSGDHKAPDDPVWVFREKMRVTVVSAKLSRTRVNQKALLAEGIVAWNMWSKGELAPRRGEKRTPYLPWEAGDEQPLLNYDVTRKPEGDREGGVLLT